MLRPCLLALGLCLPGGALAQAGQPTPLLQADLRTGRRVRIDASSEYLDAELERALGAGSGFSTQQLERVLERLRADLRRERPRTTPTLVVFLYPGRVDLERLRTLPEIFVDVELVLDPCDRTVCDEGVGKHIEMVGRAVGQPVLVTPSHRFVFKMLLLSTVAPSHGGDPGAHRVPIADCIAAAARPQGGLAWLAAHRRAADEYEPLVTRAVARRAAVRRVPLSAPPRVSREPDGAHVLLRLRGGGPRTEQEVIGALAAAIEGLRENPTTPRAIHLVVELEASGGRPALRRFHAEGGPVAQYVDGRLGAAALWQSYVEDATRRKGVTRLDFGTDER